MSEPVEKDYNYQYIIKSTDAQYKNKKFILYVKKDKQSLLKYGDLIKVNGTFNVPDVQRNYGGFNYREYLKTKKIYGSILASNQNISVIGENQGNIVLRAANDLRDSITQKIKIILPPNTSSLLIGILLGDKSDISEEVINNFKDSNLSYMLAVAGAQTSYIILEIAYIFSKNKLSKRSTNIVIMAILLSFMAITGFSPSVVRACIMAGLLLGSKIFYRKSDFWTNMAFALLLTIAVNPFSINDIGLQFSYAGTIGIVLFSKTIEKILNAGLDTIRGLKRRCTSASAE